MTQDLKMHTKNTHEKNQKDFECDSCGYSSNSSTQLSVHIKTVHLDYKDFKCEFCGKLLRSERSLKAHIKIIRGSESEM